MLSINTNLPSIIAQNSLKNSTLKLNQAVERMSTGFKINHAKDNAANYSISTNMTTKISAYQVAEDNVAMGLDLLSTANGSLDLISDKLSRLRALAEQAANGTYGEQSKSAINAEARAIIDEASRTFNNTEYNGTKLFGHSGRFLEDIQERDTSKMDTLSSVNENDAITSGTYSISSAEELAKLATMANKGNIQGGEYVLANDIDLSAYSTGNGWTPIGIENWSDKRFKGTFDGNGHVISNLYINRTATNTGLFGVVEGTIKNLGIENANVHAKSILIGSSTNNTVIENCYTSGNINGNGGGGILGLTAFSPNDTIDNTLEIRSCYSSANIVSVGNYTGGLVGLISDSCKKCVIEDCYATGDIKSSATVVGGLIGTLSADKAVVTNCYATGNVASSGEETGCGGLIGQMYSSGDVSITDCYSTGNVSGRWNDGGFIGIIGSNPNLCTISHCYSTGDVSSKKDVGGFVGLCLNGNIVITDSYCSGNIQGNTYTGGFIGYNNSVLKIQNSYALAKEGKVNGVLVGYNNNANNLTINNCGYSSELSNLSSNLVRGNSKADNITGNSIYSGKKPFKLGVIETVFQVGINSSENSQMVLETSFSIQELYSLYNLGLENQDYIEIIDGLLNKISAKQTSFGAVQNRIESALDEISTQYDNLVSSRSTLRDADIAEVSSEYIRQQILQQASATLLSTANQTPALALQLL